jgi:hypothetical protein
MTYCVLMLNKEEQAIELIAKIRTEYVSKTEKIWGITYSETYIETTGFGINKSKYNNEEGQVFFKRNKSLYIIFIVFFVITIGYGFYPYIAGQEVTEQSDIKFFYGGIGLVVTIIKYLRRKKILLIDEYGIYYCKWDDYIKWDNIVIIFEKKITSSSDDVADKSYLIIHHYSENYHIFIVDTFEIGNLDKNVSQIVNDIEYFRKKVIV